MIELLKLFWIFFKIGAFTFGGGYAMIPMIEQAVVDTYITYDLFIDMIGISESTPGPLAVNMATFIGFNQHGLLGALFATLGVVLPSFLIILAIAVIGKKLIDNKGVRFAFLGLRPAAISLIAVALVQLLLAVIFPLFSFENLSFASFDYKALIIVLVVFIISKVFKRLNPIYLILISGFLGLLLYSGVII